MKFQKLNLTLTLGLDLVDLPDGITLDAVAEAMTRDSWEDGRYPFHHEMLHVAVCQIVKNAVAAATYDAMKSLHGDERISNENGSTSKAWAETGRLVKDIGAYPYDTIQSAKLDLVLER